MVRNFEIDLLTVWPVDSLSVDHPESANRSSTFGWMFNPCAIAWRMDENLPRTKKRWRTIHAGFCQNCAQVAALIHGSKAAQQSAR